MDVILDAKRFLDQKQFDRCEQLLLEAQRTRSLTLADQANIHLELGRLYLKQNRLEDALRYAGFAVYALCCSKESSDDHRVTCDLFRASVLIRMKRFLDAQEILDRTRSIVVKDSAGHLRLDVYFKLIECEFWLVKRTKNAQPKTRVASYIKDLDDLIEKEQTISVRYGFRIAKLISLILRDEPIEQTIEQCENEYNGQRLKSSRKPLILTLHNYFLYNTSLYYLSTKIDLISAGRQIKRLQNIIQTDPRAASAWISKDNLVYGTLLLTALHNFVANKEDQAYKYLRKAEKRKFEGSQPVEILHKRLEMILMDFEIQYSIHRGQIVRAAEILKRAFASGQLDFRQRLHFLISRLAFVLGLYKPAYLHLKSAAGEHGLFVEHRSIDSKSDLYRIIQLQLYAIIVADKLREEMDDSISEEVSVLQSYFTVGFQETLKCFDSRRRKILRILHSIVLSCNPFPSPNSFQLLCQSYAECINDPEAFLLAAHVLMRMSEFKDCDVLLNELAAKFEKKMSIAKAIILLRFNRNASESEGKEAKSFMESVHEESETVKGADSTINDILNWLD